MKNIRLTLAVVLAVAFGALLCAADQQSTAQLSITKYSNTALYGAFPGPRPGSLQEIAGFMVSVCTADPKTVSFRVTMRYRVAGIEQTQVQEFPRWREYLWTTRLFQAPKDALLRSAFVEELGVNSSREFPLSE